ncbi:MAG: ATP-binding protein [Candidatus Sulfotelmatobacter sp.]
MSPQIHGKHWPPRTPVPMIERALLQIRSISHLLHPPLLDEVGLSSAIAWFLEGFTKRSGIGTSLDLQPPEFPRFPSELETAVFRIVQEALNNVFRHSGARSSWVALQHQDGQLIVSVRDNGSGIIPSVLECRPDSIGVGIGGMRQRVKEFGGELHLENCTPGTLVEFSIPASNCLHREVAVAPIKDNLPAEADAAPAPPIAALSTPSASTATVTPVSIPLPSRTTRPTAPLERACHSDPIL